MTQFDSFLPVPPENIIVSSSDRSLLSPSCCNSGVVMVQATNTGYGNNCTELRRLNSSGFRRIFVLGRTTKLSDLGCASSLEKSNFRLVCQICAPMTGSYCYLLAQMEMGSA